MDFQKLKYFISVARHLSFTKGADECHVSQTVISRQIASMERELGTELFLRTGRKIELTPAGETFFVEAVYMLQHYQSVLQQVKKTKPGLTGSLSIGFGPLEYSFVEKILPLYRKTFPDVIIKCQQFSYNVLPFRYTRGLLDLVIASKKCSDGFKNNSHTTSIYPNKWHIVAHRDHPYWDLPMEQKSSLDNQDLIVLEADYDENYEYNCIQRGFRINTYNVTNFWQSELLMLEAKIGIAFIPEFMVQTLPDSLRSQSIDLGNIQSGFTISRLQDNINPCVDNFISLLLAHLD